MTGRGNNIMIALQVQDVKEFMSRLLIGTDFDAFWLCEANVTTFVSYKIDGSLHKEFFDSEQAEMLHETERTFSTWKEIETLLLLHHERKTYPAAL